MGERKITPPPIFLKDGLIREIGTNYFVPFRKYGLERATAYFARIRAFVDVEDFFHSDAQLPYHFQRKAKIREAIAARLRRVCPDMSETEFQTLVDQMAEKQLRSEIRLSDW